MDNSSSHFDKVRFPIFSDVSFILKPCWWCWARSRSKVEEQGARSVLNRGGAQQDRKEEMVMVRRSPLGLLLLQQFLALLSPAFVDRVTRVIDLERVLVLHVGVLHLPGLFIKMQYMCHPKPKGRKNKTMRNSLHYNTSFHPFVFPSLHSFLYLFFIP